MGRKTTDEEVQRDYDEFWKRIIEHDGEVDFEQVKRELFDFHMVMQEVGKVYDHITGGKFAKPQTAAEAVIDAAEAHYKWLFAEDEPEDETMGLQSELGFPLATSERWEVKQGWEKEIAKPVVFSHMAPRDAKLILELVGECLALPGYSVDLILKAIKQRPLFSS